MLLIICMLCCLCQLCTIKSSRSPFLSWFQGLVASILNIQAGGPCTFTHYGEYSWHFMKVPRMKITHFSWIIFLQNQKCLFVPYLLGRLQADRYHSFLSVCAGESQARSPIGSALVMKIHEISWIIGAFLHQISWTFVKIHEFFQPSKLLRLVSRLVHTLYYQCTNPSVTVQLHDQLPSKRDISEHFVLLDLIDGMRRTRQSSKQKKLSKMMENHNKTKIEKQFLSVLRGYCLGFQGLAST